jgi:hypothetical protein
LENDALEAAIRERYRLLDEAGQREARLTRARLLDQKRMEDDARRQELNDMRAAQAARERAIADADRREETRATIRLIRSQQLVANQTRTQAQNAVTQRNNADIAAATQLIQRHLTVQERYAQELANLTRLQHTYNLATGRALLTDQQVARAKTALTIATVRQQQAMMGANVGAIQTRNAFGGMAMAMGQASYAAEDFIQVMSMGGGLNMALMSASNNLSMVVRALLGTSGAMAAVAGFAVPVVLISLGMYIKHLMAEEEQIDNVRHAYERLRAELERVHESRSKLLELKFALEDIALINDLQTALRDINELQRERLRIEEEIAKNQDELKAAQDDADKMLTGQAGIGEYIAELEEMRRLLEKQEDFAGRNGEIIIETLKKIENAIDSTTVSYSQLQQALATGTGEDVIAAATALQQVLESMSLQTGPAGDAMKERLDEILSSGESIETIVKRINEEMAQGAALTEDLEIKMRKLEELEQRRKELLEQQNNALRIAQEEYLLKLKMTDAERELYDLRKAQQEFMGPAAGGLIGMGGPGAAMQMMMDQVAAMGFLEAQRDALRKDLDALVPEIIVKAGLEQNAMDAQAKAFEQMQQASAKKPNPQIERTNKLLESIDTAIKNGGRIEVIQ